MASPGYKGVWESDHLACLFYICRTLVSLYYCRGGVLCHIAAKARGMTIGQVPTFLPWLVYGWHHHTAHSAYVPRAHWRESMMTDKAVYCGIHKDLGQRPQLKPFNTVILC